MKKNLLYSSLFCLFIAFSSAPIVAQVSGDNAFMIGDYIEIGISEFGYEGAPIDDAIPTHYRGYAGKLGFVANPAADGWVNYDGDFYQPGSPESGFGLGYTVGGVVKTFANNASGDMEIPGEITEYYESVDSVIVTWVGVTADSLQATLVYTLQKDQHYYRTHITLDNIGSESLTDVYYYRTLDPDNNQDIGWGFGTTNTIESQSEMADDSVIVSATQTSDWVSEMILSAHGAGWKGSRGGFFVRDPADIWNGTGGLTNVEGSSSFADQAISMAYKIEALPPGRNRVEAETFSFTTSFKRGIDFTVEDEEPGTGSINEHQIALKMYPNPADAGLVNLVVPGAFNYIISDAKGSTVLGGTGNDLTPVDLSNIEKGIYLVTILQNDAVVTKKLVVQ